VQTLHTITGNLRTQWIFEGRLKPGGQPLLVNPKKKLFSENGLHWTELWRLSYPPMMLMVDPMHCFLDGLAQYYFRVVLGLSESAAAKPGEDVVPSFRFQSSLPDQEYVNEFLERTM
jgi:hypothetical protein